MLEPRKSMTKDAADGGRTVIDAPLISAIIPTHNRAELLARAIQSVQRQTYPNLEIIVVDDASDDQTRELVERVEDPRIRYIRHDTNRGGSAARNTGIRAATGDFITFLDDDDEWEPEKTEKQLKVLDQYSVVMCTCDAIGNDLPKFDSKKTVELEDLRKGQGTFGGTGVLMARASVLKQTMFDENLPRYQDWDLFIRIAEKHTIAYLNEPLLRSDSGSHPRITNSVSKVPISGLEERFRMVHKHREFFGRRWFRRHMSDGLLYGISQRPDKVALVLYTSRRYGLLNVARALGRRIKMKMEEPSITRTTRLYGTRKVVRHG